MAENTAASGAGRGFWKNFFEKTFPPEQQALIGMLSFFLIIVVVGYVGVTEIPRMDNFTAEFDARSVQRGAALFDANCATCHGKEGQGNPGIAPALRNPDLFNGNRLRELGHAGTVRDFVELTISAGRPAKSGPWAQNMPTWAQQFGGPLRQDQVRDLTNFVMNWACEFDEECVTEEDSAVLPTVPPPATAGPTPTIDPTLPLIVCPSGPEGDCLPLEEVLANEGNAERGLALYNNEEPDRNGVVLGCQACHSLDGVAGVGPSFQGINERVPEEYDSVEAFIYTSIIHPSEYVREGFTDIMLKDFGQRLDEQMMADLIAFISSQ